MTATIKELAALVQGKVVGNGDLSIADARPLNEAGSGQITFVDSKKNLEKLIASQAAAAVVPLGSDVTDKTVIQVADPLMSFVTIVQHLQGKPAYVPTGIDPRAEVHADATLGKDCSVAATAAIGAGSRLGARCRVGAGVVIGQDCILGDDVVLHPGVVLYDNTEIGKRVIIHARAVIGADGFGYRFQQGKHEKVPQLGRVVIEDDVEIGAGTAIDRATFGATRIGQGTKIDNLVQIGHNVVIGKHNIIVAQVGIAGSCSTGDYVILAGQVGVADHVHISDRAMIGAQSGVIGDVPAGARWFGYPASPGGDMKRVLVVMQKLPEMHDDIRQIKAKLNMNCKEKAA